VKDTAVRRDQSDAAGEVQGGTPEKLPALAVVPQALEIPGEVLELE
jgi:hypothetical protein